MDNILQCRNDSRTTQEKPERLSRHGIDSKPMDLLKKWDPQHLLHLLLPVAIGTVFLFMDFTLNVVMDVSVR